MARQPAVKQSRPRELEAGTVFGLLDQVAHRLRQIHGRATRESGLTPAQYVLIRALWAQDRQSPAALASHAGCTRATMTGLLDTLEKRALVTREPNPDDRRSLLVALASKGKALRRSTVDLDRVFSSCCFGLSAREMD